VLVNIQFRNNRGSSILVVLSVISILALVSAVGSQLIANVMRSGDRSAGRLQVENMMNKVRIMLSNTSACRTRLQLAPFLPAGISHPAILDGAGHVFLQDGMVVNGWKYSISMAAQPFGRQGIVAAHNNATYSLESRWLGTLTLSADGGPLVPKPQPVSIPIFLEGNPLKTCSVQPNYTLWIGPTTGNPAFDNSRKSSVDCLDVGGRPVSVVFTVTGVSYQYYTCLIPADLLMPSYCGALGQTEVAYSSDHTRPGEGWSQDRVAEFEFSGIAAAGNVTYASASYCF